MLCIIVSCTNFNASYISNKHDWWSDTFGRGRKSSRENIIQTRRTKFAIDNFKLLECSYTFLCPSVRCSFSVLIRVRKSTLLKIGKGSSQILFFLLKLGPLKCRHIRQPDFTIFSLFCLQATSRKTCLWVQRTQFIRSCEAGWPY